MNLEVTFFLKKDIDFKSVELKNSIKNIINYVEKESFKKSKYFKFYLTKSNKRKTTDKIESI
jgi:ribosomal protein L33